ncbi:MAG: ATP-binding cassette domain-containing protein [Ruminococcaceae bacterium]|nr:ATP-binding cassette domain-containing protein [Oscillospiraceae bacterium]
MIEVKNLSKRYGSHLAVKDASFSISKGEIVGFLGPNGAGKSTIMNILTGYISLTSGSAEIGGFDIVDHPEQAKRHIGYLPEHPPLYLDMTVREYLNFIYDLKKVKFPKKPHIDEICKLVSIENVEKRLIKNLSKGYRQRVGVAQALVGNPDVLILDEPTVGLDPKQITQFRKLIEALGKHHTVIVSSHILSEIQAVCKRILIINNGEIVADDTADNLAKNLSADHTITIRVQGPQAEIEKTLLGIRGILSVKCLGVIEKGALDFEIEPEENADVRKDIFIRMSDRKWPILEFTTEEMSLEHIFLRLTDGKFTVPTKKTAKDVAETEIASSFLEGKTDEEDAE